MKNIEALIADGGEITLGALHPIECAATAADASNTLAMLVRRDGETLTALLKRLDKAIALAYENGQFIDEVNGGAD
jgi:ribosome assembly protein YihI (activator of Der GTPase)